MDFETAPIGTRDLILAISALAKCPLCRGKRYAAFDGPYFTHYADCTLLKVQANVKKGNFYPEKLASL